MRVKQVFNSGELAHLWVHQKYAVGRNSAGNMSFEGKYFFSYNTVIAELAEVPEISELAESQYNNPNDHLERPKVGSKLVVMVADNSLSRTTGKHVWDVRRAIPLDGVAIPAYVTWGMKRFNTTQTLTYLTETMLELALKLGKSIKSGLNARPAYALYLLVKHLDIKLDTLTEFQHKMYVAGEMQGEPHQHSDIDIAKALGIEEVYNLFLMRKKAAEEREEILSNPEHPEYEKLATKRQKEKDARLAKEQKEKDARLAKERELHKAALDEWISGGFIEVPLWQVMRAFDSTLIRLVEKHGEMVVETSKNMILSERDCRLAAKKVMLCRSNKTGWRKNGEQITIKSQDSSWGIDLITQDGDVVAGCHRIKWFVIEKFLLRYGWATQEDIDKVNEQHQA